MDIETFRAYCLSLPGVTEDMKWERLCFLIAEKIFVVTSLEQGNGFAIKCKPDDFDELTARDGITQAPHFARRQWISIGSLAVLNDVEIRERVQESRLLVLAKLPKKIREQYQ